MTKVKGSRVLVMGAASVVAALLLSSGLRAEDQAEGVDSGAVLRVDDGTSGDDGGLIAVDPGVPIDCEGDCAPGGDGIDSGGDAGGDDGVTDGGDGTGDEGWTDDGSGDDQSADDGTSADGTDGGAQDGSAGDGSTGGDAVPDGIFTINGDCIDCSAAPMAEGPRAGGVAPALHRANHGMGGTGPLGRGPNLCVDHPPALDWICNWQEPAR